MTPAIWIIVYGGIVFAATFIFAMLMHIPRRKNIIKKIEKARKHLKELEHNNREMNFISQENTEDGFGNRLSNLVVENSDNEALESTDSSFDSGLIRPTEGKYNIKPNRFADYDSEPESLRHGQRHSPNKSARHRKRRSKHARHRAKKHTIPMSSDDYLTHGNEDDKNIDLGLRYGSRTVFDITQPKTERPYKWGERRDDKY